MRLSSLDAFRGLTIALMIVVNSPGYLKHYVWLEHSAWDGCTLADLVFPFFIVIMGMSSVLSLSALQAKQVEHGLLIKKIIQRSLSIFALGLFLNAFPYHFDGSHLRLLGVLQRIAICYFCSSLLFLTTRIQIQVILIFLILVLYAVLTSFMTLIPGQAPLSEAGNVVAYIDRLILGPHHMYSAYFDPEGILSTIPALASALLGHVLAVHLCLHQGKTEQFYWMLKWAFGMLIVAWGWQLFLPFNKSLWSSSYVLWTSGLAYLVFAFCYSLIEIKHWTRWASPFVLFGRHAMLIYVLHILGLKLQAMMKLHQADGAIVGVRPYITHLLFSYLPPLMASLCYALSYMLICLFFLKAMSLLSRARGTISGPT